MKLAIKTLSGIAALGLLYAGTAHAEITLLDRNNGTPYLNNFKFQVGGSVRAAASNAMGGSDDGSRNHRGYDDGTRFRFTLEYYFNDDWKLLGFYEVGADIFHTVGWDRHTTPGKDYTNRRKLYGGVSSKTYGTLTYGKQESVFYQAVGKFTDVWVQDMKGQGPGNGVSGDYDGSYRARNIFMYTNNFGPFQVLASANFADSDYYPGDFVYRRKGGGSLGAIYSIEDDLKLSAAYDYNKADLREKGGDNTSWDQQMLGAALTWTPGNWYLSAMGGVYKDFIPADKGGLRSSTVLSADNYFKGSAHGWEGFVGYTFPIDTPVITAIQPYAAESAFRWDNFSATYNYLGLATKFKYGFSLWLEHQFTNTSDNQPDISKVRLRYDF